MLLALFVFGVGFVTVVGIGLYVVRRYPDRHDPRRNRERYVYPAAIALILAIGGALAFLSGGLAAIIG